MKRLTNKFRQAARYVESPVIYTLTVVSVTVSLLVYGATLVRSGDGGLLDDLRPWFGIPYALAIGSALIAILAINGRWTSMVVVVLGELVHFLALVSPARVHSFVWDEHLATSVTIACLLVSTCIHFQLVDESVDQ